jgi:hypothetical protein
MAIVLSVVPAKAGTQYSWDIVAMTKHSRLVCVYWVPAFAGKTTGVAP